MCKNGCYLKCNFVEINRHLRITFKEGGGDLDLKADQKISKGDMAYSYLKEAIITNQLQQGTLLVERQLCSILNTSRTPVREAIQKLSNEKLVNIMPNKTSFVSEIQYEDIAKVYDVREYLEKLAVNLDAKCITEPQLRELEQYAESMNQRLENNDLDTFYQIDLTFHHRLVEFAKNEYLLNVYDLIFPQIRRMTYLVHLVAEDAIETNNYHSNIVNALKRRSSEDAQQEIGQHLKQCKIMYLKLFEPVIL